jgi:hypothetical protein
MEDVVSTPGFDDYRSCNFVVPALFFAVESDPNDA